MPLVCVYQEFAEYLFLGPVDQLGAFHGKSGVTDDGEEARVNLL